MGKDLKGKELGVGLCQRKDGKYCGRYVNRFGERKSIYADTLKELKNKLAKAYHENAEKKNIVDEKTTVDQWFDKWMEVYKIPIVRERTKIMYKHIYKAKISPVIGKEKLIDVTKLKITYLINKASDNGDGWETLNKIRILLVDMFNRALEDELVVRNPAKGVRLPKNKPSNQIKALTREDQMLFFECSTGTFYHNLFVTAVNSGLRPGELFALEETDLDFEKKEIRVSKTLLYDKLEGDSQKTFHIGPPKTKTSNRVVPMNDICKNALIKQIIQHKIIIGRSPKELKFTNLLFTTKFGTPLNAEIYNGAINRIVDEVNLTRETLDKLDKFSGHTFRHTFATRCFEADIKPKTVQAYLGHATLQMTTDLYTSVMGEKKQNDMKLLEDTIGIKKPNVSQYGHENKIIQFCG